jgi:hypothetical protein
MPQVLLVVLALAAYGGLCYLAVVYVFVPAWPFMVVGGAVAGALAVVVILVLTLTRARRFAAPTVTPADVPLRLPKLRHSPRPRDDAWPGYLFAQSSTDLLTAARHVGTRVRGMWRWTAVTTYDEPGVLIFWPLLLLPLTAAVAGTAGAFAAAALLAVVIGAVLVLAVLGWAVVRQGLRGVDLGVRVLRRAKATCTHGACTYRTRLPAYRCPGDPCGRVHHDIRAGMQGLFARRCACGTLLPTTVLRAAAGLVAVCQDCGRDLRAGAGGVTEVVVPVFGSTSAGKTRLIYAGMVALGRHVAAVGGTFRPDGTDSEATFKAATTVVDTGAQTAKTAAGQPPAGITVRLGVGGRPALLHLFDAAGESFTNGDDAADLRFLDDPQGLVFVLDPFSVPAVAGALRGTLAARLEAADPAHLDPEQSYLVTIQRLRKEQLALRRMPLAVAVVKADLLLGLPPADGLTPGATSDDVRSWLHGLGLDNLLDGMERDFREVSYHLVASRDAGVDGPGEAGPISPARPLLWLLQRTGVGIRSPEAVRAS